MTTVAWLIPAFPLLGFVLILLFGRRLGDPKAGYLATTMMAASFVAAAATFFDLMSKDHEERRAISRVLSWVPVGDLQVDLSFLVDPLSITMCMFVTGIGTLIHLYAVGYMHGDARFSKFFLYLNLFALSMLVLVLGSNMLVTFLGWEGVGTCSYFLISFWHERESAATAGKKAFVTNRVGDWGFMMAMFFAFSAGATTLGYDQINSIASKGTATAVLLFAFIGACGKSAQLPLYIWLPDAMEGPTPVSALIHAATMVTAGVYLMVRISPLFELAEAYASWIIAIVGAATALFAATVAVAQNDIKKVLAYSTVSQLGYMFLAVGSGAYVAAIFHMVTHAFFKALLFLGSGSVIHGMHHEQDMRRMGALRKVMPITAATFIVGWLAIAGVPPFSGFWSKDEILLFTAAKSPILYAVGLLTAILTAFYMTRQVIMVFFGKAHWHDKADEHGAHGDHGAHGEPHESPKVMTMPLVVLAGLATVGGLIQLPSMFGIPEGWTHKLEHWLEGAGIHDLSIKKSGAYDAKQILAIVAIACAAVGIAAAIAVYAKHRFRAVEPQLLADGWRYDSSVSAFMGGPGRQAFQLVADADAKVVDGAVNGTGSGVRALASRLRTVQSGNVRNYAAAVGVGAVLLMVWFVVIRGIL